LGHAFRHALFAWLISHQPAVLFSQNKSATSNQPAVLFSQNKSAPVISHQPNEQAVVARGGSPSASIATATIRLLLRTHRSEIVWLAALHGLSLSHAATRVYTCSNSVSFFWIIQNSTVFFLPEKDCLLPQIAQNPEAQNLALGLK
jgi:hypothetical protein